MYLKNISSELAIRNLIARIAHLADSGTLEDYLEQFTEDALWGGGRHPVRRGHKEIGDYVLARRRKGHMGPGTHSIHAVTTTLIVIEGDRASGKSVYHYYRTLEREQPTLLSLGVYSDIFRKTAGTWKLCERLIDENKEPANIL